jgi:hypothetical protein
MLLLEANVNAFVAGSQAIATQGGMKPAGSLGLHSCDLAIIARIEASEAILDTVKQLVRFPLSGIRPRIRLKRIGTHLKQ